MDTFIIIISLTLLLLSLYAVYLIIFRNNKNVDQSTFAHDHIAIQTAIKEQTDDDVIGKNQQIDSVQFGKNKRAYQYKTDEKTYVATGEVEPSTNQLTNIQIEVK